MYLFDLDALNPGDVILANANSSTHLKARLQSSSIQFASKADFSHALIYVGEPNAIEAMMDGVSVLSLRRCGVKNFNSIEVFRHFDAEVSGKAASLAMLQIGQEYSVMKAIRSILPEKFEAEDASNTTFCSALIAATYKAAQAIEFEGVNPLRVKPGDFASFASFKKITESVLVAVEDDKSFEGYSFLDGDRVQSPIEAQTKIFQRYASEFKPKFTRYLEQAGFKNTANQPLQFLGYLAQVGVWKTDLFKRGEHQESSAWVGICELDRCLEGYLKQGELERALLKAEAIESDGVGALVQEAYLNPRGIDVQGVRRDLRMTEKQLKDRKEGLATAPIDPTVSASWREWLRISNVSIGFLERRAVALREIVSVTEPVHKTIT